MTELYLGIKVALIMIAILFTIVSFATIGCVMFATNLSAKLLKRKVEYNDNK